MPWKPRHPCRFPGCRGLADSGKTYCSEHETKVRSDSDKRRGSASERGYDRHWGKLRKWWLNSHPLCAMCTKEGKVTPATLVDHIIPHKGDRELFNSLNNLQSLCRLHHARKTIRENAPRVGFKS